MAPSITHYLLITLVFSLGFGQLLRLQIGSVPVFIHDLLILVILLLNLNQLKLPSLKFKLPMLLFGAGLVLGFIRALTIYPVFDLLLPSLYAYRLLSYLALFFLLLNTKLQLSANYFVVSAGISITMGLLQYFLLPDMRLFAYLGWDDHLNRLTLPHFDPTFAGAMLALYLFLIPPGYWSISLLGIPAILLTYSRSVWLALGLAYALTTKNKTLLVTGLILLGLGILALPQRFGEGNNLLRTYSLTSRVTSDWNYLTLYKEDVILGRGLNTLILDQKSGQYPINTHGPNNSYLYLLLTTGVLGLAGWLLFLRQVYLLSSHQALVVFLAVSSFANNVMFYPFTLLFLVLSFAMAPTSVSAVSPSHSRPGQQPVSLPPARPRPAGKRH